ncbi:hypothetical protein SAMN06297280_1142 [Arsukibacterium tuosuense]|uniref:Uncharacterized protein n=1 Tax=Arsukibacterium tuosuense TaxID=1323745 RepID=A0A285IF99_9GAMM|nr:hypothetical protein [Arsukibacterium tuosuense]SNY46649.1 hypothetical protein SAMN06297280_1142 [Arsukibacterium tuosuense]
MNISASQAQLLRQLNIKPLHARSSFFPESANHAAIETSDTAQLLQPDECLLSSDIKHLLAQTAVSEWLLDPASSQCALNDNGSLLVTPSLTALQQAAIKRQLWALLQQHLADDAD